MNSLISISQEDIDEANARVFIETLAQLDPDLWLIKNYLLKNRVNAAIIPPIIEQLSKVNDGSGYGEIKITIQRNRVIKCIGQEDRLLDLEIDNEQH